MDEFHCLSVCIFSQAHLRRAELQKDRARTAFVAAKLRQQGKIKSKRYANWHYVVPNKSDFAFPKWLISENLV